MQPVSAGGSRHQGLEVASRERGAAGGREAAMQVMPPAARPQGAAAPPAPTKSPWQLNSTIKGALQKTPPRGRRPSEMQQVGLDPASTLDGQVPPKHSALNETRGNGAAGRGEKAQTMSKSKRLEPCGRCQVLTAVRVALPCGRLVNLCIPCASTFARFLSRRIRDLALDRSRDRDAFAAPGPAGEPDAGSRGRQAQGQKGKAPKTGRGGAPGAEPRLESPLDMASEQLQRSVLDKDAASKVLGRCGTQIPMNTGSGGLSPTFRARKASPRRKVLGNGKDGAAGQASAERPPPRMTQQEMQLPAGACQSAVLVADPASPMPFDVAGSHASRDDNQNVIWHSLRAGGGAARQAAAKRDTDSASSSSTSSKSRQDDYRKRRSRSRDGVSVGDAASRGSIDLERAGADQRAGVSSTPTQHGNQGWDRGERDIILPHGRSVSQTNLSENRMQTLFPDLKGALSELASPQSSSPGHFLRHSSDQPVSASSISPVPQQHSAVGSVKESAVWRERGSPYAALRAGQGAIMDAVRSPSDSKANAKMPNSKQIRQRIIEDLRSRNGGMLQAKPISVVGATGHSASWSNGKRAGAGGAKVSLKMALNSVT